MKRSLAALLWFLALWTWGAIAAAFTPLPWFVGPAAGVLVAAWLLRTTVRDRLRLRSVPLATSPVALERTGRKVS